jgi:hypothetical protein
MSEATPQVKEQRSANVTALHDQLKEMAARAKTGDSTTDCRKGMQGPVLVIRGK